MRSEERKIEKISGVYIRKRHRTMLRKIMDKEKLFKVDKTM